MSVRRNALANYLSQGWVALMGLVFVPLYIQHLGIEAWGLVGLMSMLQGWLVLIDMGLTPTLSREMARFKAGLYDAQAIRELLRSVETVYVLIATAVAATVWLISSWVALQWLNTSQLPIQTVTNAISIIGFVLAARFVEQLYCGVIQGLQEQVWLSATQATVATIRWAGAVGVLFWVKNSIEAFFLWQAMVSGLSAAVLAYQTYRWLPSGERSVHFSLSAIFRIHRLAGGIMLNVLLSILLTQADKLVLSKLLSLSDFGYYTLAASAAGSLYLLTSPIVTAVSPRLSELVAKSDYQGLTAIYHRYSQWLSVITCTAGLVMATFADPLLFLWTGNYSLTEHAAPLLAFVAIGTMCNGFMNIPYSMQIAYGWIGLALRSNFIAVSIVIPTMFWAVPRFGAIGAAAVWLTLNVGYTIAVPHLMHRRLLRAEKWRWYRDSIFLPVFTGSAVVLILRYVLDLPQNRGLLLIFLGMITLLVMITIVVAVPASREFLVCQYKYLYKKFLQKLIIKPRLF